MPNLPLFQMDPSLPEWWLLIMEQVVQLDGQKPLGVMYQLVSEEVQLLISEENSSEDSTMEDEWTLEEFFEVLNWA